MGGQEVEDHCRRLLQITWLRKRGKVPDRKREGKGRVLLLLLIIF